jgi:hypothetical protein
MALGVLPFNPAPTECGLKIPPWDGVDLSVAAFTVYLA